MKTAISHVTFAVLLACGVSAHAQQSAPPKETAGQTVRIAFMDPLSGPFANVGQNQLKSWQFVAERLSGKNNPAGRVGDPEEFGLACAFLCGAKAGFITGQNILLDGGAFPGTL